MSEVAPLDDRFAGITRLYGATAAARLRESHVCVVGLGGVGSWAVEALVRSGVGRLTLIDLDDICVTNTNRQIHALDGTVGRSKARTLAERARLINPAARVDAVEEFFGPENASTLLDPSMTWVVDAIDAIRDKALLVDACHKAATPIVVSGGAGGKVDPTAVRAGALDKTGGDGLLRALRRALRCDFGHGVDSAVWKTPTVFSAEPQRFPTGDGEVCAQPADTHGRRLDCRSGFGAAAFVTGTFGFFAAGVVVSAIAEGAAAEPSPIRTGDDLRER